jgi:hypothetical protein
VRGASASIPFGGGHGIAADAATGIAAAGSGASAAVAGVAAVASGCGAAPGLAAVAANAGTAETIARDAGTTGAAIVRAAVDVAASGVATCRDTAGR